VHVFVAAASSRRAAPSWPSKLEAEGYERYLGGAAAVQASETGAVTVAIPSA
jgi:hypothetical protein